MSAPLPLLHRGFGETLRRDKWWLQPLVVFTILESRPSLRKYVPSPTGIGIGIIVPFSVVFTMFLGGLAGRVWESRFKSSADVYLIPLASGLIAGEALVAVFASLFLFFAT